MKRTVKESHNLQEKQEFVLYKLSKRINIGDHKK